MNKTKLQEFCHKKSWKLPEYSTTRVGPDHASRFKAVVSVNGLTFATQNEYKSSKEAQNEAARMAFEQLSMPQLPKDNSVLSTSSAGPSIPNSLYDIYSKLEKVQLKLQEADPSSEDEDQVPIVKEENVVTGVSHLYKNQLQTFAQKRSLPLPIYSCERQGPVHARRFRCKVNIDGRTYESCEYFTTLKDAEHAAAKAALMSLSADGVNEDDSGLFKNLLQEFAQKGSFGLPVYTTNKSGAGHMPVFISTVEIGGEKFIGQEEKNKKRAEMSAAKVAYTFLKERTSNYGKTSKTSAPLSPASKAQDVSLLASSMQIAGPTEKKQNISTNAVISSLGHPKGTQIVGRERLQASRDDLSNLSRTVDKFVTREGSSTPADLTYAHLRNPLHSHLSHPEDNSSALPSAERLANSGTDMPAEPPVDMSGLPNNVVRVYSRSSNRSFPESYIVRRDDNWVAVSTDPKRRRTLC